MKEGGFATPVRLKDRNGQVAYAGMFWDYEPDRWQNMNEPHGISVEAFDWDGDGDLDLVLGSTGGEIYLRLNEGSRAKPAFATTVAPVGDGEGKPLKLPGGESTPTLADWDGDGLFDIVSGGGEGGVFWFRNVGAKGKPAFAPPEILVQTPEMGRSDTLMDTSWPGTRTQVSVGDWDHDGDLDLLVGDYHSMPRAEGKRPEMHGFVWLVERK